MFKRIVLFVTVVIFAVVLLTGCETKKEITVLLEWTPNTNHTGLFVALDKGYYIEEGLDIIITQASEIGCADLVAAGKGEFGISHQEEVTTARTAKNPLPLKAIAAILQHNTSGFASLKEKNIETPKDFEGKKYGGWGSPFEESMLKGLMQKYDADFEKLTMVNTSAVDFLTNVQKNVDFSWIFYGWDGIAAELNGVSINFIKLRDIDEHLDYYTPLIISSESYIEQNTEKVRKFLKAASRGYEYAAKNPVECAEILLKYAPEIGREMAIASQKYLSDEYIADAQKWGVMKQEVWENYANWMYERGLIENQLNVEEAFTNEYLPE